MIINPTLILINTVLISPLHFEISLSIRKTLVLNHLLYFSTQSGELLILIYLKTVEFSTHRNSAQYSHGINLLGIQGD